MTWLYLSLAGGLGAYGRYRTDLALQNQLKRRGLIPVKPDAGLIRRTALAWPIITINIIGSFLTGLLVGHLSAETWLIIGTGLLGGWTTFSTAMVDVLNILTLPEARKTSIISGVITAAFGLLTSVASALLGLAISGM
ncbi:fluoride efflux transporter FluC [Actinomyces urinae]|uniref:fluoride efflux transporter FluC n=1 Tax=Actinomyces urinae TaxID=1689268 RepID=UPI00093193A8|nr:CrcB family protein [Actinomyces urinae]